jgi:hypothetical protein
VTKLGIATRAALRDALSALTQNNSVRVVMGERSA